MADTRTQNPAPEPGATDWTGGVSRGTNKFAIGGFVCGPVGAVTAFIPDASLIGFPVLAVGLVLSAIGLARGTLHRGLAVAGLVVALVALPVDAAATGAPPNSGSSEYSTGSYSSGSSNYSSSGSYTSTRSGTSAADEAYLATLSRYGVASRSETRAISLGHTVCGFLARGGSPADAVDVIADNGFSSTEASVIVGAAEGSYCSD